MTEITCCRQKPAIKIGGQARLMFGRAFLFMPSKPPTQCQKTMLLFSPPWNKGGLPAPARATAEAGGGVREADGEVEVKTTPPSPQFVHPGHPARHCASHREVGRAPLENKGRKEILGLKFRRAFLFMLCSTDRGGCYFLSEKEMMK